MVAVPSEGAEGRKRPGRATRSVCCRPLRAPRRHLTRADALRRIAAEVSGQLDLGSLFRDVIGYSVALFGADRVGLWLLDEASQHPFRLAAHHDVGQALIDVAADLEAGDDSAEANLAIRQREIRVLHDAPAMARSHRLALAYEAQGTKAVCFVPIVFRDEALGLLVLYHSQEHAWPDEELELARGFADQTATAIQNARLHESATGLAARLRAVQDLASRLNRITDVRAIGEAIVAEARSLIDCDNIRVYVVDHAAGMCEPIAFQGRFMGVEDPDLTLLRVPVGTGLTGWVAEHNQPVLVGDAAADPRGVNVGPAMSAESLLLVPMSYEDEVRGIVVVAKLGRNRFTSEDQTTLSVFAGYAAQAIVNAASFERLRIQQDELEHQLASHRRLLDVNEQLLSTLDAGNVLEMIADSLHAVVAYDLLAIYRLDRATRTRRAVVARDRFAEAILNYEGPMDAGLTGSVIASGEPLLANDAHLDPRSQQIPGTPFEPESMVIVPLIVKGEVIGTLNIGRLGEQAHFSANEFELTKLFAGQASIALQNAEAHRAVEVRADRDSLTGLLNHGAFQRELGNLVRDAAGPFAVLMMDLDRFKEFNDARGHPAGDTLLRAVAEAIRTATRNADQAFRYGGDEFAVLLPGATRADAYRVGDRIRRAVAEAACREEPKVTISVGTACYPDDGSTKDALVSAADGALYLTKPGRRASEIHADREDSLTALNETALLLMERLDPTDVLETIMQRAAALMGTEHGYIYLADDAGVLTVRIGSGFYESHRGYQIQRGVGVAGRIQETGQPFAVDDYDAFAGRASDMPRGVLGAVVGVPLTSGSSVVGVIGLSSGNSGRTYTERDIGVLRRFAQLASIALDNARLFESAQREVTERARAEAALRASEERFRQLSDATAEALVLHRDGAILDVNQAFCRLFGYEAADLVGKPILTLAAPAARRALRRAGAVTSTPTETLGRHRDGSTFPIEVSARTIPHVDGRPARVLTVRDIRERRELQERLARQALYDGVTTLPNRDLLMDRLGHALARSAGSEPVGLILLDLDRFRIINESLGHAVGDDLLAAVGRRLQAALRPGDTVARSGGDEFVVLLEGIGGAEDAVRVAERIEAGLASPFPVGDRQAFISASLGIVVGRPGEHTPGELLRAAEIALYRAKDEATARHVLYDNTMSSVTLERLDLENELRRAIEDSQLVVHYQPLVDLATDRIAGLEALVRWQHPTRGLMPPMSFIPLAEETGLILPLGRLVLETACRQTRKWQEQFPSTPPLLISVNLSARQFAQPGLVDEVAEILSTTGLTPGSLELEITESVVMDQSEAGTRTLHALRHLGVRIVLDDFGTGYSSLSYLKALPLDTIKIDRSFISELDGNGPNLPIVEAVISLAHGLGIDVTAEGIETADQLAFLRELICDRGQGYYYARPLPADEIADLLARSASEPIRQPEAAQTRVALRLVAGSERTDDGSV